MSPNKDKKSLAKEVENQIKDKRNRSKSINSSRNQSNDKKKQNNTSKQISNISKINPEKIDELSQEASLISALKDSINQKEDFIYNIQIGTNNLICYNTLSRKITKADIDLSKTKIKKFEAFYSTLNYKGRFYISGGYTTTKMFMCFHHKYNTFSKCADMPSGHSYHCLIGADNKVFAVSGFKSKKVEKFHVAKNKWESLPNLNTSRSWPCCITIDETYLLVFSGQCDSNEEKINVVEKINFKEKNALWEEIPINFDGDKIPFFSGIVSKGDGIYLLLGGKFLVDEDNINACFNFDVNTMTLTKDEEIKLPEKDEFDGKMFSIIENDKFGLFSALNSDKFYYFDLEAKSFEIIKYKVNE